MPAHHPQRPFGLPAGATEVVLVRHGATAVEAAEAAAVAAVGGQSDPPLAEAGRQQAIALAHRLASESFDALFVTPLRRTAQTAAPLAAATCLNPIVIPELREISLGEIEHDFVARTLRGDPLIRQITREQRWDVAPGAEPMKAFAARVATGLAAVADRTGPDRRAVVVVHGGVVAEACRQATGSEPLAFLPVDNGSITRLVRLPNGRWKLRHFNDILHLDERFTLAGQPRRPLTGQTPDAPAPAR